MTVSSNERAGALSGKVAIVTGAAQGLGATFAIELAKAGVRIVVGDLADTTAICAAVKQVGSEALGVSLDVTDPVSVEDMVRDACARFGGVDILVNNAAISGQLRLQPLTSISSAEWDRVVSVNLRGPFECIKAVAPVMKQRGYGKIINLASGTAIKGAPGIAHYVASKGGGDFADACCRSRTGGRRHSSQRARSGPHDEQSDAREPELDQRDRRQQHCGPSSET